MSEKEVYREINDIKSRLTRIEKRGWALFLVRPILNVGIYILLILALMTGLYTFGLALANTAMAKHVFNLYQKATPGEQLTILYLPVGGVIGFCSNQLWQLWQRRKKH